MCIIKNKTNQKVSGDNKGNMVGRDLIETQNAIFADEIKGLTIIENFYNTPIEETKKYYSDEYKNYINSFQELENYLFGFLFPKMVGKYDFSGDYLKFGKLLLNWIMGSNYFPIKEYENFCKVLAQTYNIPTDDIILKRWEAFGKYFSSDISSCVEIYENILKDIDNLVCPSDFIDDILIDGRNILTEAEQLNNRVFVKNPFQKEIDKHGRKLATPIYDRIKTDIYEKTLKDSFNIETKGQNTIIYGSNLSITLNEIQNLIYNTVFYGSITHTKLCREVISNIMYAYSKIYENENFYKLTLTMLALSGEFKEYQKLCLYLGNTFNFWYLPDFINEIFSLVDKTLDYKKISYNNFIYGFYGKYLDDDNFLELQDDIFKYLTDIDNININLTSNIFRNIKTNIHRNQCSEELFDIFNIYISKKYARYYIDIAPILNNIDIDNMSSKEYKKYIDIVYKISKKSEDINLNMSIAKILRKGLYTTKFTKYINDKKIMELISFEDDLQNNNQFLINMINDYNIRYEQKEKETNTVYCYNNSYSLSREYFIEMSSNEQSVSLIKDSYLSLVEKVLNSENQTNTYKLIQLKNLLLISSIEYYSCLKKEILSILNNMKYGKGKESRFINCFNYEEVDNIEIDFFKDTIKAFLNDYIDLNKIITMCFENNFNSKVSLPSVVYCLKIIGNSNKEDELILNNIYYFYIGTSQTDSSMKLEMMSLLNIFSNTKFEQEALEIIEKFSVNCTFEVAKKIINIISEFDFEKTIIILKNLKESNNYNIRKMVYNFESKQEDKQS